MKKPETNITLFHKIIDLMENRKKFPGNLSLEYVNPALTEEQILDYHFDVTFTLMYGNCEGIVLCPYLFEDSGSGKREMELGTIKTLETSDGAMRAMSVLGANFIIEATRYINEHLDDFTWMGADADMYDQDGKWRGGYTCVSMEAAEKVCRRGFRRYGAVKAVVRDNFTRKEKEVLPTLEDVRELWRTFGDVPMDPVTECMEEAFLKFPAGTSREDIWRWFEEVYHISVAEDLLGR